MLTKIPKEAYTERIGRIQEHLQKNAISGLLVMNTYNIFYTTGLFHFPNERPVALFVPASGESILFVPVMELAEAKHATIFQDIRDYFEYPGVVHPIDWMMSSLKQTYPNLTQVSIDGGSRELFLRVKELIAPTSLSVNTLIHEMRLTKDSYEVELLRSAGYYSDYIVKRGTEVAAPGMSELEMLQTISGDTLNKMIEDLGEVVYVPGGPAGGLVPSGLRTAMPHALPSAKRMEKGETLILSCGANVGGYRAECERTCFIGDVSDEQANVLEVMATAQQMAIEAMRPGNKCADIDAIALDYIRKAGYGQYLLHRTGHGKGLKEHEAPWIEVGDHTILRPGMVLSSEPGIYIEGFSGFRHSDTIIVTDDEPLVVTQFPKTLDQLIIKV
ncbi:Xaa-Pro aminopeptidase [Brevibacillus reuszeri]|uniref:M24 family metallopeptidase n=1 Tax=Brevibacillus reuszeri TaxID=54915 RepID=UPI001B21F0E6|nr:Xaa-Pro peptidase family protein [Brevibacillus reuszeri]GIO08610.1 Xaa-Pro aminopeptidase [Brevibacillus reuszeri]